MRLVLWDVDGTLVRTGGVGAAVFDVAIARVLGQDIAGHGVVMSGKTDPQIAREILATAAEEERLDELLPAVLDLLVEELSGEVETIRHQGHVLPGVEAVLRRLDGRPDVLQTLLTGNLAPNAAVKVGAFGLDEWLDLDVGAYGSDHHDRRELVALARGKVARHHGLDVPPEHVWVVGDTPRDLDCARAGGARCALVATGRYPFEELRELPADIVFEDLTDVDRVEDVLSS